MRHEKERGGIQIGREEIKCLSFPDDMTVYTGDPRNLNNNNNEIFAGEQKHCNRNENIPDGFISRLDAAEERIFEFENMSLETCKVKKKIRWGKKWSRKAKNCGIATRCVTHW